MLSDANQLDCVHHSFDAIMDSGATTQMFHYHNAFVSFIMSSTSGEYVLLANKQCVPSTGIGTVKFQLGSYFVFLQNV